MKRLIIHPKDPTTDFLAESYKDIDATVVRKKSTNSDLKQLIKDHDQIIMMGHGSHLGLYHKNKTIFLGKEYVPILRGKDCIAIWCYADTFMDYHGLSGYATSMIISEMEEALYLDVKCSDKDIEEANEALVHVLRTQLSKKLFNAKEVVSVYTSYNKEFSNPIINWNKYSL